MTDRKNAAPAEDVEETAPPGEAEGAGGEAPANAAEAAETAEAAAGVGDAAPEALAGTSAVQDRLVRLQADFENFRRRTLRERQELYGRATGDVLLELLPVLDHLELALEAAAAHDADHSVVEGFRLVADQLRGVLDRFGLKVVPGVGHPFDHAVHEAVQQAPSEEHGEGVVMMELRRGYQSGPRLLRAAQVIVSSGPPSPSGGDETVPTAEGI